MYDDRYYTQSYHRSPVRSIIPLSRRVLLPRGACCSFNTGLSLRWYPAHSLWISKICVWKVLSPSICKQEVCWWVLWFILVMRTGGVATRKSTIKTFDAIGSSTHCGCIIVFLVLTFGVEEVVANTRRWRGLNWRLFSHASFYICFAGVGHSSLMVGTAYMLAHPAAVFHSHLLSTPIRAAGSRTAGKLRFMFTNAKTRALLLIARPNAE